MRIKRGQYGSTIGRATTLFLRALATGSPTHMPLRKTASLFSLAFAMVVLLSACQQPDQPPRTRSAIQTTISSDGHLVAVLEGAATKEPKLRVKSVEGDGSWQEITIPSLTTSIRFANRGRELLLTHYTPGEMGASVLLKIDLASTGVGDKSQEDADQPMAMPDPTVLHKGPFLRHPLEVADGQTLVRTCVSTTGKDGKNTCVTSGLGTYWLLLKTDQKPVAVTKRSRAEIQTQPNLTSTGFFWVKGLGPEDGKPHPDLASYPLPGGRAPKFDVSDMTRGTRLACDYGAQRCLRQFIDKIDPVTDRYIYGLDVLYGDQACALKGVQGYSDGQSLTPDGRSAVLSLAEDAHAPRRVVVLTFTPGRCEPDAVRHLEW